MPDLKVALKDYLAPVVAYIGPQHAAIFELSHLARLPAQVARPNILCAAAIGNVVDAAAIFVPHRPDFLGPAFAELLIGQLCSQMQQPNLAFVDMAVALAPPLREAVPVTREGHRLSVG